MNAKAQYQKAYSLIRYIFWYGSRYDFGDPLHLMRDELAELPTAIKRAAAQCFNKNRGELKGSESGFYATAWYCQDCGAMLNGDGLFDDFTRPVSSGPFGDLLCSSCARRSHEAFERECEEESYWGDSYP